MYFMKIAIPSDDGINISKNLDLTKGFVVFTIQFGEIVEGEFRQSVIDENKTEKKIFNLVDDCTDLIVKESDQKSFAFSRKKELTIISTKETIISTIISSFLAESQRHDANTCCCP